MEREIQVGRSGGGLYRVRMRTGTPDDSRKLVHTWAPALARGPSTWLDRDWLWQQLDAPSELAFEVQPEWVVIADDVEEDALHDVLGVLVTSGPIAPSVAGLDIGVVGSEDLLWVEFIAIAPSIRPDCPASETRKIQLKGVGPPLMLRAIERSIELGCGGRIGLHAEGETARRTYAEKWKMQSLPEGEHPKGGTYPMFFGGSGWADDFRIRR